MSKEKRLIDANALAEHIKDLPTWWADDGDVYGVRYPDGMFECEDVISSIEDAPTVDAVKVVRCKDCKHYQSYGRTSLPVDGKSIKAGWCYRRIRYDEEYRMLPDDFCSYGERKDDE